MTMFWGMVEVPLANCWIACNELFSWNDFAFFWQITLCVVGYWDQSGCFLCLLSLTMLGSVDLVIILPIDHELAMIKFL